MQPSMTLGTEGDEVLLGVVPESASRADVVDLEVSTTPAPLAAPAVSLQHLLA